jgi:ATP-dependent phosphofructokinase / diphosphate-dependent phosphofructokinase
MSDQIHRIGVLTGGGDCPGLNAVIRAVVKTGIIEHGWEILGIENGFEGLILPGKVRLLSMGDVRGILPRGGTILGSTNRANPFAYPADLEGKEKLVDVSDQVLQRLADYQVDALVVIGGDGSLRIGQELIEKGARIVGVPKTIDNDILETDVTFGFDTAVNTAMEALDRLHTTAESHHRVMVLEVMGRHAGWIALKAGIAGGADVILIPEIPFDPDVINEKITSRMYKAKFSLVVVAEGARPMTAAGQPGEFVYQQGRTIGAEQRLGGIGEVIAQQIAASCNIETRVIVLGHLQRGGSPSAFDRLLGSRFGTRAVQLVAQGLFGQMAALHGEEIVSVPIERAVASQKFVPLGSDLIDTAFGLGLSLGNTREAISIS